jgi:hypothetical protein
VNFSAKLHPLAVCGADDRPSDDWASDRVKREEIALYRLRRSIYRMTSFQHFALSLHDIWENCFGK